MPSRLAPHHHGPLLTLGLLLAVAAPAAAQFTLPPRFVDEQLIGGLSYPVGMAYLPDGRLLIIEQVSAKVRLLVNGALGATDPVVTVADVNTNDTERGLLGITVDPGWPTRPYIYVQYNRASTVKICISRYTASGDLAFTGNGALTINPASRYDILTDLPDAAPNHNGGTLRFGPDGMLYSSLGDDATGCPAQDVTVLVGKILRLDVSGLPAGGGGPPAKGLITPTNNPFVTNPNLNARLVWLSGLRNPFRFAIDRLSGNMLIGDVGENAWEEVDYDTSPAIVLNGR
jgi:glucose/arabinose dehydrogenase